MFNDLEKSYVDHKGILTCETKIGKGNHEITAIVDLYKLNSDNYDFAKIRFMSGNSPFRKRDSSSERIYLDDVDYCKNGFEMFAGDRRHATQILSIDKLCMTMPSSDEIGKISLHCTLTNKYGGYPKYLEYDIAKWDDNYSICEGGQGDEPKPIPFTTYIGDDDRRIIVKTLLKKDIGFENYNYAEIKFTYEPTGLDLIYHQREEACIADAIYLYNQNTRESHIYMYTQRHFCSREDSGQQILYVDNLSITFPTQEKCGEIILVGEYPWKDRNRDREITEILASWNLEDVRCD